MTVSLARMPIDIGAVKPCPHCSRPNLTVGSDFGTTIKRGVEVIQSWCRRCRAETNYNGRPRKNRTKNGAPR
jgi:hypothetical protein